MIRYPDDASVYIGGFFSVYLTGPNGCSSTVDPYSIQEFEAVRWIIDKLNNNAFLKGGHKIGIHAFKTCGIPEIAVSKALELSQAYSNTSQIPLVFAMLSPTDSSETKAVSRVFSSLPEQDRLLMLGYGATSSKLGDQSIYKNFFRIIPPGDIQVQVMLQLMLELKWNYVAIIYEDVDYGGDTARLLRTMANEKGVCIPVYHSFTRVHYTENFTSFIYAVLDFKISGIVYIGSGSFIKKLFEKFTTIIDDLDIEFIVSGSNKLLPTYFHRLEKESFPMAKGALVTSIPKIHIQEFDDYWKGIKASMFARSWLNITKQSDFDNLEQSVYVSYAIKAVLLLANLFKKLQMEICTNDTFCSQLLELPKQRYIDEMEVMDMNLTDTFPFTLQMFQNSSSKKMTFTPSREIDYNSEPSDTIYEVYNYQQCNGVEDCRFMKVGSFKDQKLQLNRSAIRSYPLDGNANPYDVASIAQCPQDPVCSVCVPSDLPDRVLFLKGDWYVVAVVPIYQRKDGYHFKCSKEIRVSLGNDIAESIKFAIENINIELSSLTGKNSTVGLIVINGCESELVIKDKMFRLHKGTYKLRPGILSSEINHRILGYVGGLSSSMSTAIAEVLTKLGYVQVSYASTSPFLSDKTLYPYFLRIPTADDQQAQVIIDIVTSLESTIIQVLYTNGSYGEGGLSALQKLGTTKGVCIIPNEITVTEDYTVFNGLLAKLRQTPQAKLVVTFVRSHLIQPVITSVIQKMQTNEFIFIGSETWGGRESMFLERNRAKLHGSLTISLDLPPVPQFTSYLSEQNINDPSNPWHRYFWEKRGNCIFPGSFQRSGKLDNNDKTMECNLTTLAQPPHDPWIPFAVAATKALVSGVKQVMLSKICNSSMTTCAERNPHLIAKNMKTKVKLDLYGNGTATRIFDDTGNGVVEYQILHITMDSSSGMTQYKQIGSWSKTQGMKFNKGYLHFPLKKYKSLCLTDHECSKCIRPNEADDKVTGSTSWMVYTLIGFGCLLLLCFLVIVILCYRIRHMIQREGEYMDVINIHTSVKNKVSNVSNKSDIYLTAKSSLGIEPYKKEEDRPPNPCLLLPKEQIITVESNKHGTQLSQL
ncbi:hypothetical protein SNE40_017046 [Patella caerulea]